MKLVTSLLTRLGLPVCLYLASQGAGADSQVTVAPVSSPTQAVAASANLDFNINIGKFIYFRVGSGVFPVVNASVDTVAFDALASIPPLPANGNAQATSWNGSVPVFTSTSTTMLPVEVRSNAGQVSIRATASEPLSNGADTIPFADVHIVSSDNNLPAPVIPNSGTGTAVNVAGTAFANLITERSANWTFSYSGGGASTAGSYSGTVTFTASAL